MRRQGEERRRRAVALAQARSAQPRGAVHRLALGTELRDQLLKKKQEQKDQDAGAPKPEDEKLLKKKEQEILSF